MQDDEDRPLPDFSLFNEWPRLFCELLIIYVAMTAAVVVTISAVWLFTLAMIRLGEFLFGV